MLHALGPALPVRVDYNLLNVVGVFEIPFEHLHALTGGVTRESGPTVKGSTPWGSADPIPPILVERLSVPGSHQ